MHIKQTACKSLGTPPPPRNVAARRLNLVDWQLADYQALVFKINQHCNCKMEFVSQLEVIILGGDSNAIIIKSGATLCYTYSPYSCDT